MTCQRDATIPLTNIYHSAIFSLNISKSYSTLHIFRRCISLVVSAIAFPHITRAGVVNDGPDESRRQYRLRDLSFLLSVPSQVQ